MPDKKDVAEDGESKDGVQNVKLKDETKNVKPNTIPLLPWDSTENRQDSVKTLYEGLQDRYCSVIGWYLRRKGSKKVLAQIFRSLAIIFTTVATVGLIVTAMHAGEPWAKIVGTVSSALLVVAAGLTAYDHFFGFSSSWVRYILVELSLQEALDRFQVELNRLSMKENQCSDEILEAKMEEIRKTYLFLDSQLRAEAHQWATEFRIHLNRPVAELMEELRASGRGADGGANAAADRVSR